MHVYKNFSTKVISTHGFKNIDYDEGVHRLGINIKLHRDQQYYLNFLFLFLIENIFSLSFSFPGEIRQG